MNKVSPILSPRSPNRGRSYSPHSTRSSSSRSRSRSYSRPRSRSRSPYHRREYRGYYSRSPPGPRSPSRRYRSRSPPPPLRRKPLKECRVYVSNLPFDTAWHELKDFMRDAGPVAHVDILKTPEGRSKGCGLVEYRYPEDAKRAIDMLNSATFLGRPVHIREDRDFNYSGPSKDSREIPDDCRLHVSNLPPSASWQDMKDLFRRAGRVLHTDVHSDPGSRVTNGNGTVIFDEPRFARNAIDMLDGFEWRGYKLVVRKGNYVERRLLDNRVSRESTPAAKQESIINPSPPQQKEVPTEIETYEPVFVHGGPEATNIAPPPPPPPPAYNHMGLVGGPAANLPTHGHNQIFVNNLPFSTTWQDLIDLFRHAGPVIRSEILTANGYPKGSGFVRFEDASTCERAINKFNGYMYGGRQLDIQFDKYSTII